MFAPLGVAYIASLLCSLVVSLTVTPVLGSLLLPNAPFLGESEDPWVLRSLKAIVERVLRWTLRHAHAVLVVTSALVAVSLAAIFWMGGEFLPPFHEGTLTINVQAEPGTSLAESRRVARLVEERLLSVPEVLSVSRRTGRAELDEHADGVNSSEIDVGLVPYQQPRAGFGYTLLRMVPGLHVHGWTHQGRPRAEVIADIRDKVTSVPGVKVNLGQPISHRLDHIMSGVRAQIAVKLFGPDLRELRTLSEDVQARMATVPGVVDLQVEPQVEVPQLRLRVRHEQAARHGLSPADIAEMLEIAHRGRTVSQVLDEDRFFDLVVWFDESARNDPYEIHKTILDTPSGRKVALGDVAEVLDTTGPNALHREDVQRRMVVFSNVQGRDLAGAVRDIQRELASVAEAMRGLPGDYHLEIGGQFEAQQEANRRLALLGSCAVVGVFLLLWKSLHSWVAALQVLANIPLAAMGSILALLLTNWPAPELLQATSWWNWPRVWIEATSLSVAHWVGFITLIGIVSRNGIMMISHYIHLMEREGEPFGEALVIRGSLERLAPVLMTACTSFFGLLPLLFGAGQPGKEILYPLTVVVFGGMLGSTILDQIVTPALFYAFGSRVVRRRQKWGRERFFRHGLRSRSGQWGDSTLAVARYLARSAVISGCSAARS